MASRAAPWCDRCGTVARFYGDMSWLGICEECSQWALVDNFHGMVDKQSVVYKRWLVAHQMSNMGRPRKYTPTAAERIAIKSVHAQNCDNNASCVSDRSMPTLRELTVDAGGHKDGHDGGCKEVSS